YFGCNPKPPHLVIWDTQVNSRRRGFAVPGVVVRPVAFSPDGRVLSTSDEEHAIRLFEIASGKERRILRGHQSEINRAAFSPDNRHFASASADAPIFVWDTWQTNDGPPRTEVDRQALWATMADDDAAMAFQAMCRLLAAPAEAVTMIKANLKPEAPLQ